MLDPGHAPLEPDRHEIEVFTDALFRHAAPQGFVSLRAFHDNATNKVFRITPTQLTGGLNFLIEAAEDDARRAAQAPDKIVFCPPISTFLSKANAQEANIAQALALSVECDAHPTEARTKLERLLGEATCVVRSGGKWTDPATGLQHDKLHLHWRLAKPAQGAQALAALKEARRLATKIAGADASNVPACHPIRWPGSWHRKAEPVLCSIDTVYTDREIDLDAALTLLREAAPAEPERQQSNGADCGDPSQPADWPYAKILTGESYHEPLVRLAAMYVAAGMSDGAITNSLRALMDASTGPHDVERWQPRRDAIPRIVRSAREKFAPPPNTKKSEAPAGPLETFSAAEFQGKEPPARRWLAYERLPMRTVTMLSGDGATGKTTIALQLSVVVAARLSGWLNAVIEEYGPVLFYTAEEDKEELHRRVDAIVKHHGIAYPADLHFHCATELNPQLATLKGGQLETSPIYESLRRRLEELHPKLVVLESSADLFGGDEINRSQVRLFISYLRKLARDFDCAVLLLSHPSVRGMADDTGTSGNTAWNNSVRARMYFKTVEDSPGLRRLEIKKNNYGPEGETVTVKWVDGIYVPEALPGSLEREAEDRKIDELFLTILRRLYKQNRAVSDKTSKAYAPSVFSSEPEAGHVPQAGKAFTAAMIRLFAANRIRVEEDGPPSRRRRYIVEAGSDLFEAVPA
jgi:RecA-family ATPase